MILALTIMIIITMIMTMAITMIMMTVMIINCTNDILLTNVWKMLVLCVCKSGSIFINMFLYLLCIRPCLQLFNNHDDVMKWKHFRRYWPFVRGIHRSPVNSPHKGQWRRALMFSLICVWINGWINNREAGDLRRPRAHCDVIVMTIIGAKAACNYCDNGTAAYFSNIFISTSTFCNIYGFVQIFTRHKLCSYTSMIYPREISSFNSKEDIMYVCNHFYPQVSWGEYI